MPEPTKALTVAGEERTIQFVPFGSSDAIKLSVKIVREMIAVPTRTGKLPSETECIKFMMLCKARHLNPFEGDAFLLGYDTNSGPAFSLITAHQVFLKRAESSEQFDGMESGVIINDDEGRLLEREGDITFEGETLLGGWAKVYRKDRSKPTYRRLRFQTFSTGRSRWEKDGPGMIVKCAEADALRSSFPTHLGGLYTRDERAPELEMVEVPQGKIGRTERKLLPIEAAVEQESSPGSKTKPQTESSGGESGEGETEPGDSPAQKDGAPTLKENRAAIEAKLRALNIGKTRFVKTLEENEMIPAVCPFDDVPNETLQEALDGWDEFQPKLMPK